MIQSCDDSSKDCSVEWEERFFVTADGFCGYAYFPVTEPDLMDHWHDCFLSFMNPHDPATLKGRTVKTVNGNVFELSLDRELIKQVLQEFLDICDRYRYGDTGIPMPEKERDAAFYEGDPVEEILLGPIVSKSL